MESSSTKRARLSQVVSTVLLANNLQKGSIQSLIIQSIAILLSVTILFLLTQVYFIFVPCLKALLWALLCGSALYPFKYRLAKVSREWFEELDERNESFCIGFLLLPVQLCHLIYMRLFRYMYANLVFYVIFNFRYEILNYSRILLPWFSTIQFNKLAWIIAVCLIIIHILIVVCTSSEQRNFIPSLLVFIAAFIIYNYFGIFGQFTVLFTICMITIGLMTTGYSIVRGLPNGFVHLLHDRENFRNKIDSYTKWLRMRYSIDQTDGNGSSIGQLFISVLFTISIFVILEHLNISTIVLAVLFVHLILRQMFAILNSYQFIDVAFELVKCAMWQLWLTFKQDSMLRILIHFFNESDRLIKMCLTNCLDLLTSIGLFVIVGLLFTFSLVFVSIKIYGECYQTIYLLQNELKNIEIIEKSINMTIKHFNTSDESFKNFINDRFNLEDDEKIFLHKMLSEFRMNILPWLNRTGNGPSLSSADGASDLKGKWLSQSLTHWPTLWQFVQWNNLKQTFSLLQTQASAYLPLIKSLISISYAFVFVVLDSGTMLISFVFNFIIFLLALFYLLSSSHNKYKPIELMDQIWTNLVTKQGANDAGENHFSAYVEQVVNGIFAATIKISIFYGIYTWLLHSLFAIDICYIPSVIAAILAAIPLLNAYWASLPACIYLYYSSGLLRSVFMLSMAVLPSFIVDSSIYSNIGEGIGHPYLTGLAITCGVVYYGVEGAVFGPLWLCLLIIIMNMCTQIDITISGD